jgi:hypothetical protein
MEILATFLRRPAAPSERVPLWTYGGCVHSVQRLGVAPKISDGITESLPASVFVTRI